MAVFEQGRTKTGGRGKGVRNKISMAFLEALSKHFDEIGHKAIEVVFEERPHEYLKIVASLLPKEFEITENKLVDIADDELDAIIEYARRSLAARLERAERREDQALN
jgi:hypothetical protein